VAWLQNVEFVWSTNSMMFDEVKFPSEIYSAMSQGAGVTPYSLLYKKAQPERGGLFCAVPVHKRIGKFVVF